MLVAAFGAFVALAVGLTAKQNWERRRFRSGLADFAGGGFTEGGGGDGMDAGLLTRGPGMATSLEMTSLSPQKEPEPEPEPEG